MCLAIPGKIIKKENNTGLVDIGGIQKEIFLPLVPEAKEGDWVLIHTGFAIHKISEKEAKETIQLLNEAINNK